MVDWKNIGVPIIVALVAGTVALIGALVNYIIAALFTPAIDITREVDEVEEITEETDPPDMTGAIDVRNVGSAPAKGLKITIEAPHFVEFKEPPFSTERFTYNMTTGLAGSEPDSLEIYIPRFVHGPGSMIRIETLLHSSFSSTPGYYTVYATHDGGSIRKSIPVTDFMVETPRPPLTFPEQYDVFWDQWGTTISSALFGISLLMVPWIIRRIRKRREIQ